MKDLKINILVFVLILTTSVACKPQATDVVFSEKEKILVQESEEVYLNRFIDWVIDKDEQFIYVSSNENQILQLHTQNGALSLFYEMDSTKVNHFYRKLIQHYSGIDFKYTPDELANEYTILIDRFWLTNDTLFANLTFQFSINGSYNGYKARHVLFFGAVVLFDITTHQLLETYINPDKISSGYDSIDSKTKAYISGQRALAYHNHAFYFGNVGSTNFDSLDLLIKIPQNYFSAIQKDTSFHKINVDEFLIDLKTVDKNKEGRLFFYRTYAVEHGGQLYFSEGKNVYDVEKKEPYALLVNKPYQHLSIFNLLPSGNIMYVSSNDTVIDKNILYYNVVTQTSHTIKKLDANVKKVLFGKHYVYELIYEDEKYYLVKYPYEEK